MANKEPYGPPAEADYADPGYQPDGVKRYPLSSAEKVRAAWSYINHPDNAALYSAEHLAEIKGRIKAAAAKFGIEIEQQEQKSAQPPRENLVRALSLAPELRAVDESGLGVLVLRFAPFNQWAKIDSSWEGHFMERVSPNALTKTIKENRANMRALFQHGQDPSIGEKVLGPINDLGVDEQSAYAEIPLLDTSYNRDLKPGLEAGLYGTSWRMRVTKESFDKRVKASEHNPDALPERTIEEMALYEFGPVTFPAYAGGSAGVRSLTDDFIIRRLIGDPDGLRHLISLAPSVSTPSPSEPAQTTQKPVGAAANVAPRQPRFRTTEEYQEWLSRISTNSAQ